MARDAPAPGAIRRRTFLGALGGAGLAGLAGCSGDGGAGGGNGGGGTGGSGTGGQPGGGTDVPTATSTHRPASGGGTFDCSDLNRGSQPFDPDGRAFVTVWDFPASFGDVERQMANTDSIAGARLAHLASKQSGYWPFIVQVMQNVHPTDAEGAEAFVHNPAYQDTTPVEYDGEDVDRSTYGLESSRTWHLALPGEQAGQFHTTTVILSVEDDEPYGACADAAVSVAQGIMDTFRPNPAA